MFCSVLLCCVRFISVRFGSIGGGCALAFTSSLQHLWQLSPSGRLLPPPSTIPAPWPAPPHLRSKPVDSSPKCETSVSLRCCIRLPVSRPICSRQGLERRFVGRVCIVVLGFGRRGGCVAERCGWVLRLRGTVGVEGRRE